jgi:type II secretory pathway predicted ATPase ExeA
MYKHFFGLKLNPFDINPDPEFLVAADHTMEVLSSLSHGIQRHKGFIQLTGEVGTGKTLLLNAVLRRLDQNPLYKSAFIFNPRLEADDFLRLIVAEFGLDSSTGRKSDLLRLLNQWLLERYAAGETVVLIVDEAQDLTPDVLEEIRLLTNLETTTQKLLQIVLAGQPELEVMLKDPRLRQLRQRITLRCKTYPFTCEETMAYIESRMKIAGRTTGAAFSVAAMQAVFDYSRGIARVINILCEHSLIKGYLLDECPIRPRTIEQVSEEFGLDLRPCAVANIEERRSRDREPQAIEDHPIVKKVTP